MVAGSPRTMRVPVDGIELVADAVGDDDWPPVVLLHGGGQTRHAWGTAATALAASGFQATSYDLRGHGDSDWSPDGGYSIGRFAGDVRALASRLPRAPVLVGASLGGISALVAVGENEAPMAAALVLVDVTPRIEGGGLRKIQAFMRAGMRGFDTLDDAADSIATFVPHRRRPTNLTGLQKNLRLRGDGRWYWHWDPRFIANTDGVDGQEGVVRHERLCAAARAVTIPTLLVRGQQSDIVSEEGVRELRQLIPHAEVVDVAGAGHMVAGDKNDVFNEAVIEFVQRVAP